MTVRLVAAVAALACLPAFAAAQTNLRLLTGFDPRFTPQVVVVGGFTEAVKKATNNSINFTVHGADVVPPFEQFQPLASGAFDLLFTVQPYHLGTTAVSFGLWALEPAPAKWRADGVWDFLDKEYNRHGVKLIAIVSQSKAGVGIFHALMKQPMAAGDDFKGKKIRGNPYYKPFVDHFGGAMVTLAPGEIYSGLQRGVVDGAFWSGIGSLDFKWYEVAPYMTRPTFGYGYYFILANRERFAKLSAAEQKAMLDAGRAIESSGMEEMTQLQDKEFAELKARGVKEIMLDPAKVQAGFDAIVKGVWATAEASKASGEQVKAFRAFLASKGYKVQ
jgi:TRAP-type C4-dicarboxylate transport system substrate-binding protein